MSGDGDVSDSLPTLPGRLLARTRMNGGGGDDMPKLCMSSLSLVCAWSDLRLAKGRFLGQFSAVGGGGEDNHCRCGHAASWPA